MRKDRLLLIKGQLLNLNLNILLTSRNSHPAPKNKILEIHKHLHRDCTIPLIPRLSLVNAQRGSQRAFLGRISW